jgi:hypothetical protein
MTILTAPDAVTVLVGPLRFQLDLAPRRRAAWWCRLTGRRLRWVRLGMC